jgi:hypothetical protein
MIGLYSGTNSRGIVIGGILTIAIAHPLSDAVWAATVVTFLSKLYAITFVIPVLLFDSSTAIITNLVWGISLLTILSYYLVKSQGVKPWRESNFRTYNHNNLSRIPYSFSW